MTPSEATVEAVKAALLHAGASDYRAASMAPAAINAHLAAMRDEGMEAVRHMLRIEGRSYSETAKALGLSRQQVGGIAQRMGLKCLEEPTRSKSYLRIVTGTGPIKGAAPWESRQPGECAFPISAWGEPVESCRAPCDGTYCDAHKHVMFVARPLRVELHARSA